MKQKIFITARNGLSKRQSLEKETRTMITDRDFI